MEGHSNRVLASLELADRSAKASWKAALGQSGTTERLQSARDRTAVRAGGGGGVAVPFALTGRQHKLGVLVVTPLQRWRPASLRVIGFVGVVDESARVRVMTRTGNDRSNWTSSSHSQ